MNTTNSPHMHSHTHTKMSTTYRSPHRKNIRQTSATPSSTSSSASPWKDSLKAMCLERAREKRKQAMMKKRSPAGTAAVNANSNGNSSSPFHLHPRPNHNLGNYNSVNNHHFMDCVNETQEQNHSQAKDEARQLIQEQLQETGTRVLYSSNSDLRIKNPNSTLVNVPSPFSTPTKQYKGSHDINTAMMNNPYNNMNVNGSGSNSSNRISFHFSPAPKSLFVNINNINNQNQNNNNENSSIPSTMAQIPAAPFTPLSVNKGTPYHGHNNYSGNNENWISEGELFELMQEIEEEIKMEQG